VLSNMILCAQSRLGSQTLQAIPNFELGLACGYQLQVLTHWDAHGVCNAQQISWAAVVAAFRGQLHVVDHCIRNSLPEPSHSSRKSTAPETSPLPLAEQQKFDEGALCEAQFISSLKPTTYVWLVGQVHDVGLCLHPEREQRLSSGLASCLDWIAR